MVTKEEQNESENKYEIFQKAYADANALLSRQFLQNYISLILYFFSWVVGGSQQLHGWWVV